MGNEYALMHKNTAYGIAHIDSESGALLSCRIMEPAYAPFLGHADTGKMKKWWNMRAIPGTRGALEQVLRNAGCQNSTSYLAKNLAVSVTDTYWICPVDLKLTWEDVRPVSLITSMDGKLPYHNATSFNPNASLGGQLDKYWDLTENPPHLVKKAYAYFGQQSINEVFATRLHQKQSSKISYAKYSIRSEEDGGLSSRPPC